jgi:hypothetical protein
MKRARGRRLRCLAACAPLAAAGPAAAGIAGAGLIERSFGAPPEARSAAAYNLPSYPHAAFVWFPSSPHPGEPVLLASVSTDPTSPIISYAWDLGQGAGFVTGRPTLYTSFTTYAPRTVRLRVINGKALSDIATQTIHMSAPPATVLQPFPVVRVVSVLKRSGIAIRLLAVEAGAGARSTISCRGAGCPVRSEARVLPSSPRGAVSVRFRRFERFLPAGTLLQIRVFKAPTIGSYTRLLVRRHRLPARTDSCLDPSALSPITCPSS